MVQPSICRLVIFIGTFNLLNAFTLGPVLLEPNGERVEADEDVIRPGCVDDCEDFGRVERSIGGCDGVVGCYEACCCSLNSALRDCCTCNCQCLKYYRDAVWTDWTPWSCCTASCGGGTRTRTRGCTGKVGLGADCTNGSPSETENCFTHDCRTVACVDIPAGNRRECGPTTEADCTSAGCCWASDGSTPSCYVQNGQYLYTGNSTGYLFAHKIDKPPETTFVSFKVDVGRGAAIGLATTHLDVNSIVHEVKINEGDNGAICLASGGSCLSTTAINPITNVIQANTFRDIWISWGSGLLSVGSGTTSTTGLLGSTTVTSVTIAGIAVKTINDCGVWDTEFCSWDTHWCWPGECGGIPSDCECATGFTQDPEGTGKCLFEDAPYSELLTCHLQVEDNETGEIKQSILGDPVTDCASEQDNYINFQPDTFEHEYELEFSVPGFTLPLVADHPSWVNTWDYGLLEGNVEYNQYSLTMDKTTLTSYDIADPSQGQCDNAFSRLDPTNNLLISCTLTDDVPAVTLSDGERYCHDIELVGGGHINFNIWDGTVYRWELDDTKSYKSMCMLYDDTKPEHCHNNADLTCDVWTDPMDISEPLCEDGTVEVTMLEYSDPIPTGGFENNTSGIESYEVIAYEVVNNLADPMPISTIIQTQVIGENAVIELTLPTEPMMYALYASVKDRAGNFREARRFVLYDQSSQILLREDQQMDSPTAAENTDYIWQTNNLVVRFRWDGFFYNDYYAVNNIVQAKIADASRWEGIYEAIGGSYEQLKVTGTPEVDGIIRFHYYIADDEDYVPTWDEYTLSTDAEFAALLMTVAASCSDGDKYIMHMTATDPMERNRTEVTPIYIDSTTPELRLYGVDHNGENYLYVHYNEDLSTMVIPYDAWDIHSNIIGVAWTLGTCEGCDDVGAGNMAVDTYAKDVPCPDSSTCLCPMIGVCQEYKYTVELNSLITANKNIGRHHRTYYFNMTITNAAMLTSDDAYEILLDESPPVTGHVFDGVEDVPDVDFVDNQQVSAYWRGFYDHESDIYVYRYAIADRCLPQQAFLDLTDSELTTIFGNSSKNEFFTGETTILTHYFVTVVAFNYAMAPSEPICSDGVHVDTTATVIKEVEIKGGQVAMGTGCFNNTEYIIWPNRTKQALPSNQACGSICGTDMPELYMIKTVPGNLTEEETAALCTLYSTYADGQISLSRDTIVMYWEYDEPDGQVDYFEVGFATNPGASANPDIIGYQRASGKGHFVKRDTAFGHGTVMYIILKVLNKAGFETIEVLGPVHIDETSPLFTGTITPAVTLDTVTISWLQADIVDPESGVSGLVEIALGTQNDPEEVLAYGIITSYDVCNADDFCITVPTPVIQDHDQEAMKQYKFSIKVCNGAGLCTIATSEEFIVLSRSGPSSGILADIDPKTAGDRKFQDVDYLFHQGELCYRWAGYFHPILTVEFSMVVGTTPGGDDIGTAALGPDVTGHCFTGLTLNHIAVYYGTLTASTEVGDIITTTDGATFIDQTLELSNGKVHSGPACFKSKDVEDVGTSVTLTAGEVRGYQFVIPTNDVGQWFTLSTVALCVDEPNYEFHVNGKHIRANVARIDNTRCVFYVSFQSDRNENDFAVTNIGSSVVNINTITAVLCSSDLSYQRSTSDFDVWWKFDLDATFENFLTHYEVALVEESTTSVEECTVAPVTCEPDYNGTDPCSAESCSSEIIVEETGYVTQWINANINHNYRFSGLHLTPGYKYSAHVRPCIDNICLDPVSSNGTKIFNSVPNFGALNADATFQYSMENSTDAVIEMDASWQAFIESYAAVSEDVHIYKWTISTSAEVPIKILDWQFVIGNEYDGDMYQVSYTTIHPVHWRKELYFFLVGCSESGMCISTSVPISITTQLDHTGSGMYVYDIDWDEDIKDIIGPFLHSQDIGRYIDSLHNIDVDYTIRTDKMRGIISGAEHTTFYWWLSTDLRTTYTDCEADDPRCISYETTSLNRHEFRDMSLTHGVKHYICTSTDELTLTREPFGIEDTIPALTKCSNGFVVDTTPPTAGTVRTGYQDEDYQSDTEEVHVEWEGFSDLEEEVTMGDILHTHGIKEYRLKIGSCPECEDIIHSTSYGHATQAIVRGIHLMSGHTYYATVEAYDHVGLMSSALSHGLVVDQTPPTAGKVHVGNFHQHMTGVYCTQFEVHWRGFSDDDSATLDFEIAIGSVPSTNDILPWDQVEGEFAVMSDVPGMEPGNNFYVSIKALNSVGLATVVTSDVFVCDVTAPEGGFVRDGPVSPEGDIDYGTDLLTLTANWGGFIDGQTDIMYYLFGVGTEPFMVDVRPFEHVSLNTEIAVHLKMTTGIKYYVTIHACNQVNLCRAVCSDGIIMDNTPPISGDVWVGYGGQGVHTAYLPDPGAFSAHWFGFHDPHSGLHHYEVCIGTTAGGCEVMDYINVYLVSTITFSGLTLPEGVALYFTVKAYNNVNMTITRTADPVYVDSSPPTFIVAPQFSMTGVGVVQDKQIDRSQEEEELYDGSVYNVDITACNNAGLCTTATAGPLLVDSSRPVLGDLVEMEPPMTWSVSGSNTDVTLNWEGFADPHSDIITYTFKIGTTFGGGEISAGIRTIPHDGSVDLQTSVFNCAYVVTNGEKIYITMWAINSVDLVSHVDHLSLIAMSAGGPSGDLLIERHSCDVHSCQEDCTCAVVGWQCKHILHADPCVDASSNPTRILVHDGWSSADEDLTGNANCLRAHWEDTLAGQDPKVIRYEWSFGRQGFQPGAGIFDLQAERIFYEVNERTDTIWCSKRGVRLQHDVVYVTYVRAWWSETSYTQYVSDGIKVDLILPSARRGGAVKDIPNPIGNTDLDYTTISDQIHHNWLNTFIDLTSPISVYEYSVGTQQGADTVINVEEISAPVYTGGATSLSLLSGIKHIGTVRAYNELGMGVTLYSDGVTLDTEPPLPGEVYIGGRPRTSRWLPYPDCIEGFWFGFDDHHSFVKHYEWGIGSRDGSDNVVAFTNVNIMTSVSQCGLGLSAGPEYYLTVRCSDAAGLTTSVSAESFQYDDTPPVGVECLTYSSNLVQDSNFTAFTGDIPDTWSYTGFANATGEEVHLRGDLMQNISLVEHMMYWVEVIANEPCVGINSRIKVGFTEALLDMEPTLDARCRFGMEFVSHETNAKSLLRVRSYEGMNLAEVHVKECSGYPTEVSDPHTAVKVTMIGASDAKITWAIDDRESSINQYQIGIGTTAGGFQLHLLENFGIQNAYFAYNLHVSHRVSVYATIITDNKAGHRTIITSEPAIVDWTPPDIDITDVSILPDSTPGMYTVSATWEVKDMESGVMGCSWGIGLAPGALSLQHWVLVNMDNTGTSDPLSLMDGHRVYVSVRCSNKVHLHTTHTAPPVTVAAQPPNITLANLNVLSLTTTGFHPRDGHQVQMSTVHVFIEGVVDTAGVSHYIIAIKDGQTDVVTPTNVGTNTDVTFTGLDLRTGTSYDVVVTAVSNSGQESEELIAPVTIVTANPTESGTFMQPSWHNNTYVVIQWDNNFNNPEPGDIIYEVFIGTMAGAGNLVAGVETTDTQYAFRHKRLESGLDLFMTLKAIGPSGLYVVKEGSVQVP